MVVVWRVGSRDGGDGGGDGDGFTSRHGAKPGPVVTAIKSIV